MELRKVPEEVMYYDFRDETQIDEKFDRIAICGNHHFMEFGNPQVLEIIHGDYYDEEVGYDYDVLEMLEKVTGKKWEEGTLRGYSQGDWQNIYYVPEEVSQEEINSIEDFYMGKITEFADDENCHYYVPDDIVWKGKKAIADYLGFSEEGLKVFETDGYEKVYKYKEID